MNLFIRFLILEVVGKLINKDYKGGTPNNSEMC